MPLLRFDLIEGRTDAELKGLLDAAHDAVVEAFAVPPRDRYQVVHEHKASRLVVEDTGLGIPRSDKVVVLQVTSRPRERAAKEAFYRLLCEKLEARCGIAPSDVMVSLVVNGDDDWSFGLGRAQFLTGELGSPQESGAHTHASVAEKTDAAPASVGVSLANSSEDRMATRRIYTSSNGDVWDLAKDGARIYVVHKSNPSSGGAVTDYSLDAFLSQDRHSPQNMALVALIGAVADGSPDRT